VISLCIYGVDLNPLAVDLCQLGLWMEGQDPGRILTFLDNHIKCGNSLVGTSPDLASRGIPDDAFAPVTGDDKKRASEYKKANKGERELLERGYAQAGLGGMTSADWDELQQS